MTGQPLPDREVIVPDSAGVKDIPFGYQVQYRSGGTTVTDEQNYGEFISTDIVSSPAVAGKVETPVIDPSSLYVEYIYQPDGTVLANIEFDFATSQADVTYEVAYAKTA